MMKLELVKLLGEGGALESTLIISYCHLVLCACFDIVSIPLHQNYCHLDCTVLLGNQ